MRRKISAVAAVLFFLYATAVLAEERFGVTVYPGAKYDADSSDFLKKSGIAKEAATFRTNDSVGKVVDFYKSQQGFKNLSITKEGGMFTKNNVDVTIQNPWMNMATGKMISDTLISIVKRP
jgi:hypothetical protein